ncbi:hypothetical protein DM02DRAFT_723518 [Periconia macrospinosa]|uniref:Uncharacterized protein n=1 Tax=Periconia macrospinosa TaxID=97972 RepID=A0A2V1E9M7_9PLEO|nr:hypothetical protein DM02DRAFT_723518 [Periconia macrospinosa]
MIKARPDDECGPTGATSVWTTPQAVAYKQQRAKVARTRLSANHYIRPQGRRSCSGPRASGELVHLPRGLLAQAQKKVWWGARFRMPWGHGGITVRDLGHQFHGQANDVASARLQNNLTGHMKRVVAREVGGQKGMLSERASERKGGRALPPNRQREGVDVSERVREGRRQAGQGRIETLLSLSLSPRQAGRQAQAQGCTRMVN